MTDSPYTNREIREFFSEVRNDLTEIKTQTKLTNGRVSELEKWKAYVLGFCGAVAMLLIPVLVKLFTS